MPALRAQGPSQVIVAAGTTQTVTFDDLGVYEVATVLAKATLTAGASLTITAEVRPAASCTDWFDTYVIDLAGATTSTLAANIVVAASTTRALMRLPLAAESLRISLQNTGEAAATVDLWVGLGG